VFSVPPDYPQLRTTIVVSDSDWVETVEKIAPDGKAVATGLGHAFKKIKAPNSKPAH